MTALSFESPVEIVLPDAAEAGAVLQPENPVVIAVVAEGPQGIPGTAGIGTPGQDGPPGPGVPIGGSANQVLAKIDGGSYNTQWVDPATGGGSDVALDADGTLTVDATTVELATDAQLSAHTGNTSNPHSVTKSQVGLGNVDNVSDASKPVSTAQAAADTAVASAAAAALTAHEADTTSVHGIADTSVLATSSTVSAAISALSSVYQPLDSDLTNIAALSTTSYGRAFLELANQAALMGLLSAATASASGIVELATTGETTTGTDTVRAVTPAGVKAATDALSSVYQPLDGDLTSIAALTTTTYGRAFLALANQAALFALFTGTPSSSTYLRGDGSWSTPAGGGAVATDTIFDTKGDLAVGTGSDTAAKLAAGTNGYALVADSTQSTGLKYAAVPTVEAWDDVVTALSGKVHRWQFEETSGATVADSIGSLTLTLTGTAGTNYARNITGPTTLGKATQFISARAESSGLGSIPVASADRTVVFVYRTTSTAGSTPFMYGTLAAYQLFYAGFYESSHGFTPSVGGSSDQLIATNWPIADGQWHMCAMGLLNSGYSRWGYIDKLLTGATYSTAANTPSSGNITVGQAVNGGTQFVGDVADMIVFNRSLARDELDRLYRGFRGVAV